MSDGFSKFKQGIQLDPQSADPSNPAEGDIFYSDGTSRDEGLHVYKDAAWSKIQAGSVAASFTVVNKTTTGSLATSNEDIVTADSTGGDLTLNLPAASGNSGLRYTIIKTVDTNTVIIDPSGSENINGETTFELESIYDSVQIVCNGTSWFIETCDTPVAARYTTNTGQTVATGSTPTTILFEDKQYDTHNAYNTATGIYTIPVDGFYSIKSLVLMDGANVAGALRAFTRLVEGSGDSNLLSGAPVNQAAGYTLFYLIGSTDRYFAKGETLLIDVQHNTGVTNSLEVGGPENNFFSIMRIK